MLEFLGYSSAILIGITLGLIGSGGSILTVPILVYLFQINPVLATGYSLFIVGLTALVGSVNYMKKQLVNFKTAIVFSIPSFIGVFLSRKFIVPSIPKEILHLGNFTLTKEIFLMILFSVLMIGTAISMIRHGKIEESTNESFSKINFVLIFLEGFVIGIITGLVGAGGGFLIIPALVLFAKIPMKLAIGTSLLIIAIKSLIGFLGDLGGEFIIDWIFLFKFSAFTIGGIFLGVYFSKFVSSKKLKPIFGWFVLLMGIYIFIKELF